jgi:hypothetical protein
MAVLNPSFETVGASAGLAASWTLSVTATYEELAEYGTPAEGWETFESGWGNTPHYSAFTGIGTDLTAAEYDNGTITPDTFDGFEDSWGNEPHITELSLTEAALYDSGTDSEETFEDSDAWDATYKTAFTGIGVDLTAALYDTTESQESFEAGDGWDATYSTTLGAIDPADYPYWNHPGNGILNDVWEDFEEALAPQTFSVNTATDVITTDAAHGLVIGNNEPVQFRRNDGALPTPLTEVDKYWCAPSSTTQLTVSLSFGGPTVDITDIGTGGDFELVPHPSVFWNTFMETI